MHDKFAPKIFLSSTKNDLKDERSVAIDSIQKNYLCLNMENWGASPDSPKEKIVEELKQAAGIVLILGFKYGSLMEGEDKSFTEFEFDFSIENEIPILAFIKENENGKWESDETDEFLNNKLIKFKKKIENGPTVAYFKDNHELIENILITLSKNNEKLHYNKYFTNHFFKNKLMSAKADLGERYSPEVNVDLDLDFFNTMAKNNSFKRAFEERFISYYCDLKKLKVFSENTEEFNQVLKDFKNEKDEIFSDISYDFFNLYQLLSNIDKCLSKIFNNLEEGSDEKHDVDVLIHRSREYMDKLISFPYKLLKNPILFLSGEAGKGKSHLLADLAFNRLNNSEVSILLLGSHFNPNENIGKQIVNELELNMSSLEFLEKLNNKAKYQDSRIFIMIDALNECKDKDLWKNHLSSFIQDIKNFEWLGLILSIRTTYLDILPENIIEENNQYVHHGFGEKTYDAVKLFCKENNVDYPSFPILNPEFSNPLFLKLLFKNLKKSNSTTIPQNEIHFSLIVDNFLENIEKSIHETPGIPSRINVTEKFLNKVIELKIQNPSSDLLYEDLMKIGNGICSDMNVSNYSLIDDLINEGLFHEDLINKKSILRFSYEKIEDYLIASYLLDDVSAENLHDEFKFGGKIYEVLNDGDEINYLGVLELFSILIPEKYGCEIYEFDFSQFKLKNNIEANLFYWLINSFYWRNPSEIPERIFDYIREEILESHEKFSLFFESLLLLSANPNFCFNAERLHEILSNNPMPKRDSFWLPWINHQYYFKNSVHRILSWVFSFDENITIDDDSVKLVSITLSWFLASNNEKLRDESTYALIHLLKDNFNILFELLEKFEGIDDIFILERLYAVTYNYVLECGNNDEIKSLAEIAYNNVIVNENIELNILLNDYAQCIVEYANLKLNCDFTIPKNNFNHHFLEIPLGNDIEMIKAQCYNEKLRGSCYIFASMNLNLGNFGSKEFKNKLRYWKNNVDINDMEKLVITKTFEFYDENLHGEFDIRLERNKYWGPYIYTHRIGEKYQRIVFYELLYVLSKMYEIEIIGDKKGKHYINGAWEIGIRKFDPTFNFKDKLKLETNFSNLVNFNVDDDIWSENVYDLPDMIQLINQKNIFDENDDWLTLFGQINLNDSNKISLDCNEPHKGFYLDLWALIINSEEKKEILQNLEYEGISDILPDSEEFYQVFDKEFSWANSYVDLECRDEFEELFYLNHDKLNSIHVPFVENVWEFKNYLTDNFNKNILKPSGLLFEKLNLEYGELDNVLYSNGEKTIVDLSNENEFEYLLIINKHELFSFLNENNLDIIWLISGAKITFENWVPDYDKKLYLRGIYYLNENGEVNGNLIYNHHS